MKRNQQHIIKRQLIDFRIPDKKYAHDLQVSFSDVFKKRLIPLLDSICSELASEDELVKIDRLEIDLGMIDPEKLLHDFPNQVQLQFRDLLIRKIYKAREGSVSQGIQIEKISPLSRNKAVNSSHSQLEILIFYLKNGRFPWWASSSISKKVEPLIREAEEESASIFSGEICLLFYIENSRSRIIHHLTEKELIKLLKHTEPQRALLIEQGWIHLRKMVNTGFLNKKIMEDIRDQYFDLAIQEFIVKRKPARQKENVHKIIRNVFRKVVLTNSMAKKDISKLEIQAENVSNQLRTNNLEIPTVGKAMISEDKEKKVFSLPKPTENENIAIPNAGLVLLWPYLEMFFSELGLLRSSEFADEMARMRAIHLLHFIHSGAENCEEHELVLNKILCGLEVQNFVSDRFAISRKEKQECENLLKAVIRNWPVLKNTSIATFRNTFLQKKGLLSKEAYGWLLQVERSAVDILLDKLTWPISVVKLPWNHHLIHVQW